MRNNYTTMQSLPVQKVTASWTRSPNVSPSDYYHLLCSNQPPPRSPVLEVQAKDQRSTSLHRIPKTMRVERKLSLTISRWKQIVKRENENIDFKMLLAI